MPPELNFIGGTRRDAEYSLPWLWKMNYDTGEYLNNSVDPIYSVMANASIMTISSHGGSGFVRCPDNHTQWAPRDTRLTGKYYSGCPYYSRSISSHPYMNNMKLIIFVSCNSGYTDDNYGNLCNAAVSRGADTAMGWMSVIPANTTTSKWLEYFFQACYFNKATVNAAAATATQRLRNEGFPSAEIDKLAYYATNNGDTCIYT